MAYHYTASRISGENAVFPDELIIDSSGVTYRKGKVIGNNSVKIQYGAIGSVSLDKHLLFADVIIETNGGKIVRAEGFTRSDAEEIVGLLNYMCSGGGQAMTQYGRDNRTDSSNTQSSNTNSQSNIQNAAGCLLLAAAIYGLYKLLNNKKS